MIDQTYYLPMVPGGIPVRVPVSQYDAGAGRNIIFTLIGPNSQAFEVPDGADITCDGTKKDKKAFSYAVTADGSTVTVPVEEQMTAAAGPVVCQITITSDGAVLGSANFVLDVERAALADDADMSETEIASLQTWLTEAIAARDAAAAAETAAEESAEAAVTSAAESAKSATNSANSATAAEEAAQAAEEAASTAASEAAEATAAEIKESIQTELDAKADKTDLDDAVKDIATNAANISDLQEDVSGLNSNWFGDGTAIPANADLNDYNTPGKYYSYSGSITTTLSNVPSDVVSGFSLYVLCQTVTYLYQIMTVSTAATNQIYIRMSSDRAGSWETAVWHLVGLTSVS